MPPSLRPDVVVAICAQACLIRAILVTLVAAGLLVLGIAAPAG